MQNEEELKTVSIVIPILNEEYYVEKLLTSILNQDYNMDIVEILFVDGESTDNTVKLIEENLKDKNINYKILYNPEKITPKSVNIGIENAKNDIIIRLDAHCEYPSNYISKCVYYLNKTKADNVGCLTYAKSEGTVGNAICDVLSSKFGVGNSKFRTNAQSGYVDTVPFGTFRRSLFEKIGYFNEELIRSEDNEINYRIIKNGGKVYLFNDIGVMYYPRNTIKGLLKMAFDNGKWSTYTSYFIPGSMKLRHFIPLFFVISLIAGLVISICKVKILTILFLLEIALYILLDLIFSFKNIKKGLVHCLLCLIIYPLFHISYGVGSISGLFMILKKKYNKRKKTKILENTIYEYDEKSLRNLQLKSLEMFRYVKKFCEDNNLTIYFCGGCCIGTIRHKGFVPWDDDIDIYMPRESYNRIQEIWKEKADTSRYECVIPSENNYTRNIFITINDNNTTFIKTHQVDLDINHGIVIDILPLDGCPTNRMQRLMQKFWALIYSLYCAQMVPKNHGILVNFIGRVMLFMVPIKKIRWKIARLAERKMTKYKISECDYITELCSGPKYMQNEYKKEWFETAIYKDFEGEKMPIPVGYDSYLKMVFGDYMKLPPPEKQIPEHNVVYCDLNKSYKCYKGKYYC